MCSEFPRYEADIGAPFLVYRSRGSQKQTMPDLAVLSVADSVPEPACQFVFGGRLQSIVRMAVPNSRILKIAGLSLVGFCAVSIGADRANVGPMASQIAGFCGAFLGALVAKRRKGSVTQMLDEQPQKAGTGPPHPLAGKPPQKN